LTGSLVNSLYRSFAKSKAEIVKRIATFLFFTREMAVVSFEI